MSGSSGTVSAPTKHPEADELEVTVLGGGTGESVVVHLGNGEWLIVDSFVDDDEPAAERYLRMIDADLDRVRMVVATHWDNDHIQGLAALLRVCPRAPLGFPNGLDRGELAAFVRSQTHPIVDNVGGPRTREINAAFEEAAGRPPYIERFRPLLAGQPLFLRDAPLASVTALAPCPEDILAAQAEAAQFRRANRSNLVKRFRNDLSAVVQVSLGCAHAVLGADLEAKADGRRAWKAVIDFAPKPPGTPDLLKVPHHGSDDAHEPRLWEEWLAPRPKSVVTGWQGPKYHRPTSTDVERLQGLSEKVWIAGYPPALLSWLAIQGQPVMVRTNNVGRVTARRRAEGTVWDIQHEGMAAVVG